MQYALKVLGLKTSLLICSICDLKFRVRPILICTVLHVCLGCALVPQRSIDVAQLCTHVGQFLSEMGYFKQAESMLQQAHKNLEEVKTSNIIFVRM